MGETGTVVDYATSSKRELVQHFQQMQGEITAHPPPGFDVKEWEALASELVSRLQGGTGSDGNP